MNQERTAFLFSDPLHQPEKPEPLKKPEKVVPLYLPFGTGRTRACNNCRGKEGLPSVGNHKDVGDAHMNINDASRVIGTVKTIIQLVKVENGSIHLCQRCFAVHTKAKVKK